MTKEIARIFNNSKDKSKGGYDCPVCHNRRGWIVFEWHNGLEYECWKRCYCVNGIRTQSNIKKSGLGDMVEKFRFDNFSITENHHAIMRNKANKFLTEGNGRWLAFFGQSGCGKTHICTAVCNELLRQGKSVAYLRWAVELKRLKMNVTDSNFYESFIDKVFENDVIYIDDLYKRSNGAMPTDADIRLMFEIVDMATTQGKILIMSGEDTQEKLIKIDEATAGRIAQNCGEFFTEISKDSKKNYRITNKR